MPIKKKPTICFFGTYDTTYTSNRLVLAGLAINGSTVVEVNAHIKVTTLNKKSEMGFWPLLKRVLKKYRLIGTVIEHANSIKKCDVIYVGYPGHFDVIPAWIVAKLFGKKLVFNPLLIFYTGFTEEQGILSKHSILGRLVKYTESRIYQMCDLVFADTPFQEEYLMRVMGVPKTNIRVLPIGADDHVYAYTPYQNRSNVVNVVYYGLYSPIHGVEYIIEAANLLKDQKHIHFTFVGNGQTFQKNYDRATSLALPNCTFYYNIPESEHIAILQKADMFLGFLAKHPSVDRVIPNKVYQGLSLGKAVITADAPVIRSVFSHKKTMYLVPPADGAAFAHAVRDLAEHPTERMRIAQRGYEVFKKQFSARAVGAELIHYIEEII